MASKVTAADLVAMKAGAKLSDEDRLYWRRNSDGTITGYQRVTQAGRDIDVRVGRVPPLARKADLAAVRAAAAQARLEAQAGVVAPVGRNGAATKPRDNAMTLGQVWGDMLAAIRVGRAWNERNLHGNELRIEKHVKPSRLWDRPVAFIEPHDLHALLLPLRKATPDQERKLRGLLSKTFTHAQVLKLVQTNPVPPTLAMLNNTSKAPQREHFAALLEWDDLRALARAIVNMDGSLSMRAALLVQAHTTLRTSEVVGAKWSEIDLDAGVWSIPRKRMKIKEPSSRGPHVIPLPPTLRDYIKGLPKRGEFVFANARGTGPVSGLDKAMREGLGMAGLHVPHGWRSSLTTLAGDAMDAEGRPLFAESWVRAVKDHLSADELDNAYKRKQSQAGAGKVFAWWAEQLGVL